MKRFHVFTFAFIFLSGALLSAQPAIEHTCTVFRAGEDSTHTYRIPAIVQARSGVILAFAEARRENAKDAGDIDLVLKRSSDGGRTWSEMITVWEDGVNTCGNPSPVVLESGRIVLLTTWNHGRDRSRLIKERRGRDTRRAFVMFSDDEGLTWSSAREITADVKLPDWTWYATGPCHAIVKQKAPHKGRIIVPCDHNTEVDEITYSHFIYSDDGGESWHLGAVSEPANNESTVAELPDGSLLLNMRGVRTVEKNAQYRALALSRDGGITLRPQLKHKSLQEPVCEGSMINFSKNGKLTRTLLFSNPDYMKDRRFMTIKRSDDCGRTWKVALKLSDSPAAYSDMVILQDTDVGILYETGEESAYEQIAFSIVRF